MDAAEAISSFQSILKLINPKNMGFYATLILTLNFPTGSAVKNLPAGDLGSVPGVGRSPGEGNGHPVPEESHGQRSLAGYSPWGHRESDTKEQLEKGGGWCVSRGQAGGLS